jgi:putative ABC transport system permease protein
MELRLILRNIWRRRRRSLLTVAGITLGAASYMILVAAAGGFLHQFRTLVRILGSPVVIQQAAATSPWGSWLNRDQVEGVRSLDGVASVSRVALGKTRLEGSPYFLIYGVDPSEPMITRLAVSKGRAIRSRANEVMFGERAALRYGFEVGDEIVVRRRPLTVVGWYRTHHDIVDSGAVIDLPLVQHLFNYGDRVNVGFVDLVNPDARDGVLAAIAAAFPELEASTSETFLDVYRQADLVEGFARFLAGMVLLIAALGVANVMHVNVNDRTRELAILRAVGWSRARVARQVLFEGLMLATLGALIAVPAAAGALWLVSSTYLGDANSHGYIPQALRLRPAVEGFFVAVIAGGLGTIPPLVRALRLATAKALREE